MKLQQLRYIWEVAQHELNVSATAESLFTSQPGISKQIRLLEDELGVPVFARNGKHLTEMTLPGQQIVQLAGRILAHVEDIRNIADEFRDNKKGVLSIATTHTQARYALPQTVKVFMARYPEVELSMIQGTPMQIADIVARGNANIAIATEAMELFDNLIMLPCYEWNRCVVVETGHPLAKLKRISLEDIVQYPIITYVQGFTGRSQLDAAFDQHDLKPHIALTAVDADVIKTYARLGLGVGIIAKQAYDAEHDRGLVALDASHLFPNSRTSVAVRKDTFLRSYVYDFVEFFAPHLTRSRVEAALLLRHTAEVDALFQDVTLPVH